MARKDESVLTYNSSSMMDESTLEQSLQCWECITT